MNPSRALAISTTLLLAMTLLPQAQAAQETPLSPTSSTLYTKADPAGRNNHLLTVTAGTASDDVATNGPVLDLVQFRLVSGPLATDTYLAEGEPINATAVLNGVVGTIRASSLLLQGTRVVAFGAEQEHAFTADTRDFVWEMEPRVAFLEHDVPLTWLVNVTGTSGGVSMTMGSATGSRIQFPAIPTPPPPPVPVVNLPWPLPVVYGNFSYSEPATVDIVYHWANGTANVTAYYFTNRTAGSLRMQVVDASGATVFDESTSTDGGLMLPLRRLEPGNWTVRLQFRGFVGEAEAFVGDERLLEEPDLRPGHPGARPPTLAPPLRDNDANQGGLSEREAVPMVELRDSPAAPFVALLAALAALAIALRRR